MRSLFAQRAERIEARIASTFSAPISVFPTHIAALAVDSLIAEVSLTPKPGLVDSRGSGAHADLDIELIYPRAMAEIRFSVTQTLAGAVFDRTSSFPVFLVT